MRNVAGARIDAFDAAAGDGDVAGCGPFLSEDHAKQRALAAAGLAEQDDKLAFFDLEVQVFEDRLAVPFANRIGDRDAVDDGNGRGGSRRRSATRCSAVSSRAQD